MKAIVQDVYGSPDVLQLREVEAPALGLDDVRLRVQAAGVDFGVWHLMTGLPLIGRLAFGLRKPSNPVRGLEVAGIVESVGANVKDFKPGDEVFGTCGGSFAELAIAQTRTLSVKPKNLSFAQAAAVPISATTALTAVRAAKVKAGQKVLVIGAGGGVGSFAVQMAKAMGAEVTGVCSTSKLELVRSLGATHVIDYTREDFSTGAQRYDVIIDTAGNRPLGIIRRALTPTGTFALVGGEGGGRWFGPLGRSVRAVFAFLFARQSFKWILGLVNRDDLVALTQLIESGQVMPSVGTTYSLAQAPDAIRAMTAGQVRGKAVVVL